MGGWRLLAIYVHVERDVPVLIFSAGLADIIEEVLRQKLHRSFKNVRIVSNRMVFNDDGRLVGFKGKTIHVLNKNEHALEMAAPVHDHLGDDDGTADDTASVKKRTNVLLLGDHLGDLGMSDGLNYENRIAVGFLVAPPPSQTAYSHFLERLSPQFELMPPRIQGANVIIFQAADKVLPGMGIVAAWCSTK
ncbi:hypothetical protein ACLOJK_040716 [Asimina triloba]